MCFILKGTFPSVTCAQCFKECPESFSVCCKQKEGRGEEAIRKTIMCSANQHISENLDNEQQTRV